MACWRRLFSELKPFCVLRRLGVAGLALAALSACDKLERPSPMPPVPVAQPASAPQTQALPAPTPKRIAKPKPAQPTAPTPVAPIILAGLSRSDLLKTLGEPNERIEHNPGQTWIYRAGTCTVEVLFLFDMTRNDMFSIDRKVNGTDGTEQAEQRCLQRIKNAHGN